jgi:multidrug efflux system membrane fusion protein
MANDVTHQKLARPLAPPAPAPLNGSNGAGPSATQRYAPPPKVKKSSSGSWLWLVVLLIIVAAAGWAAYHFLYQKPAQGATGAQATTGTGTHHRGGAGDKIRIVPATATKGDVGVYLVGLGAVTPYNTVTIQARVSGQLMQVNFTDGQTVKKGAKLVQIDDRPYKALLEQYQAQKEHDQALLDNANVDLKRYQVLYAQNSIQQQTLDTQVALVKQDQGTVDSDQAQIDQTQLNIDYCDITSPIDGVVGLRLVDVGNQVTANSSNLLIVNQVQPIYVDFTIPEDSVPDVTAKLKDGLKLDVAAYDRAQKNKLADGYLLTTDNQIDPSTGTLKLRAQFDNKDNALFSNQFVNVKLLLETKKNVVIIPVAAIQYGTQGTFVYTVDDDDPRNATVAMKNVKVGTIDGDKAEITSGVDEDDEVVVDGVDKLSNGTKVIVAKSDDASGSNGASAPSVPAN